MLIDRIIYPVASLGPGKRAVVWTRGCRRHCPGCIAEAACSFDPSFDRPVSQVLDCLQAAVAGQSPDGLTISGGEPLDQFEELRILLAEARPRFDDILIYTGYTLEELKKVLPDDGFAFLCSHIDVLVDGPYVQALNDGKAVLRGSTNQRIHFMSPGIAPRYNQYLEKGRTVQNILANGRLLSIGIQEPLTVGHHGQPAKSLPDAGVAVSRT